MKKIIIFSVIIVVLIVCFISFIFKDYFWSSGGKTTGVIKTNGLIMLIEFEKIEGILNWEKELDKRGLTALIKAQSNVLEEYPEVFKRLADKGHEVAGGYDSEPFWDMPYEKQYNYMKEEGELIKKITGKPMRVFGSRYFAYDENTLKAADDLGIEYVLARGTQKEKAVVYSPKEYNVKIISVSNIVFEDMGSGSLCDYSLWARGATADEFGKVVQESISKNPDSIILVSHAYLGGTKIDWWKVYENALNSDKIFWRGFNEWISKAPSLRMSNAEILDNREVKYVAPNPAVPIEDLESIDLQCQ